MRIRGAGAAIAKDEPLTDAAWTQRLRERFPVGTSGDTVVAELRRQGFEIKPGENAGSSSWTAFPCSHTLVATWSLGSSGKLTSIDGRYLSACT
jgi:hypothetical protein